jgi:pimeloyl-ACP methyl ester carboxylesterase
MADHTTLAGVVPLLEPHFTVHALDRRGRGASTDRPGYAVEHEFADVALVVDTIAARTGRPVALYGHSYGATCALGAARITDEVHRLALYEPAFRGIFDYPPGFLERLETLIAEDQPEQAVELAMRERAGASLAQLKAMKAMPSWPARVAAAAAIPRELRVDATRAFDPDSHAAITTPTLLLLGEHGPPGQQAITTAIAATIANSKIVSLPGQEHMAQVTAPQLVADNLIQFMADAA